AGPGSGKTRVLVHRIAYLIRVRRENPKGIIALTYNRHASVEIRQRLKELIGEDAQGVTVLTCHSLAMRLAGISITDQNETDNGNLFKESLRLATDLLNGEELDADEADDQRERLLRGFRWILVDEYQDIDKEQYELISALAGRSLQDSESKLTLFAVGDDDQNIYSFQGASVEFIRKFETDYNAQLKYLTENYRSTHNIVDASNTIIQGARDRMKANHPIRVNKARIKDAPGGVWTDLDVVSKGRVQILQLEQNNQVFQARVVMEELLRMSKLDPDWDWSRCAVIARKWDSLAPVQSFCETRNIPVEMARDEIPNFWRLRQTRSFVDWLRNRESRLVKEEEMKIWLETQAPDYWQELLVQAIDEHALEVGGEEYPVDQVIEWLVEWGREIRRRQKNLLLLTAHRAKGLEFDHVAILDGNWNHGENKDSDAHLRLYYVAMTRAQKTLTLARFKRFKSLQHVDSIAYRSPAEFSPCTNQFYFKYDRSSLKNVNISFAGFKNPNNRIHKAIADLAIGNSLKIKFGKDNKWVVMDANNQLVGKMAGSFQPRNGMRIKSARVFAIVGWCRELSKPEFQARLQSENWEVVLPEIIYEPINFPDKHPQ
ncbi:MAG: ATP-dependent helicase, partial [Rhodobacteraceae bacterium]|nr:ATP-dependent helicase [Paracoccaceae bacterium]